MKFNEREQFSYLMNCHPTDTVITLPFLIRSNLINVIEPTTSRNLIPHGFELGHFLTDKHRRNNQGYGEKSTFKTKLRSYMQKNQQAQRIY